MQIFRTLSDFHKARRELTGISSLGLVPTMGALHAGHASLAQRAVEENDYALATIFVNPTQFGPNEDLDRYPRTLEADIELLEKIGVKGVLAPDVQEIYGNEPSLIKFVIEGMAQKLCGATRPGHFDGVLQIVAILFNLTRPDTVYFGKKDFQQLMIIKRMVKELHFPLEIVGCPIVREKDGLAMSSRNRYLNPEEREQSLFLYHTLSKVRKQFADFSKPEDLQEFVQTELGKYPLVTLDYFQVLEEEDLSDNEDLQSMEKPHIFVAAYLGKTRLIDNAAV